MPKNSHRAPLRERVLRLGRVGWAVVGIAAAVVVVYSAVSMLSGLAVPLVVAVVLGVLLHPVVDWLERRGLPRGIGASLVLVALAVVVGVAVWVTVVGVIEQSTEIVDRLTVGLTELASLEVQFAGAAVDLSVVDLGEATQAISGGIASLFGSVFSGAAAFAMGTFIAVFFLFYILADWARVKGFVMRYTAIGATSGHDVVEEATITLRRYFGAMTLSNLIAAVLIALAAALMDVPLAFSIGLVTFVTSYVPFLGAIFSGAFAVLIALGSRGPVHALVLLGVILVMQNLLQTLILTKLSSDRLRLHPIVNLGSTVAGTVFAGLLGATLSAPLVVMLRDVVGHLRERPDDGEAPRPTPAAPAPSPEEDAP
ncbi:AI-2E family transporter [Xylanimonas ulmi]|uniref:Putative PurR-regulated permease PerM n=1 Tax=Xylanimonas ulmi TaxID=228973 RepID=A0A4Q7M0W5_9MICO|nr:AI-2E family transporter [Xylanibacterium ulmi]RZS60397.1 putative PurR-regulated permease PerM [Xylanibacterium ulmi]